MYAQNLLQLCTAHDLSAKGEGVIQWNQLVGDTHAKTSVEKIQEYFMGIEFGRSQDCIRFQINQ